MDRVRSRPSDSQEGWKEGSEDRAGSKTSWADAVDPQAPSPGTMGQYNKSAAQQDYQVCIMLASLPCTVGQETSQCLSYTV